MKTTEVAKMKIRMGAYLLQYFFPAGGVTSIMESLHSLRKKPALHSNARSNHKLQEKGLVILLNAIKQ